MSKIKNIYKYITDSEYRFLNKAYHGRLNSMDDEKYIMRMFYSKLGYTLNLSNPETFNEKLQWLKLNDRNPQYTCMVDKYAVKSYIAEKIGKQYIIPTLGLWNSFDAIEFDKLPEQFVLKCTHDSGGGVICEDKNIFDYSFAKQKICNALRRNYYYFGREWPYKNVTPCIIAEPYLEDSEIKELRDYKFFCFGGKVRCFKVDFDRFKNHRANYYTPNGELLELGEVVCPPDFRRDIRMPEKLDKMMELAGKLSESIPFLRTDFYEVDGKIYFGELTFFPNSGFGKFVFEGNDEMLGSWIKIP